MSKILQIWAREILDSRASPTVETSCRLNTGQVLVTSVPSGVSVGAREALELRDKDEGRYKGKGVLKAIANVNQILGPSLVGFDPQNQKEIDRHLIELDATENKSKFGANSILSVSQVVAKAGAVAANMPLYRYVSELSKKFAIKKQIKIPTPLFLMIEGGLHGAGNLDFQEFFVIPASSKTYQDGLRLGTEIYLTLGENLDKRGAISSVGDEGGYAPNLFTNADALEIMVETIKLTGYSLGRDVSLGLDVAAVTLYKQGSYQIKDKSSPLTEEQMIEYYKNLNESYHLAILEDPLHEEAWSGWTKLLAAIGAETTVVGDDLLVTNPIRVDKAIAQKACNAIIIKPNQIGTVSETLEVVSKTSQVGWKSVVSHRGGETNDAFLADFAVGVGGDYAKFGAPARGERLAKYNRLSAIDLELRNG